MICIHHNKDLDGFTSGAIVKRKYPNAKLIGWDYSEELPDFAQFVGEDVIMIDITFKIDKLVELARISRLTVIDHHIGIRRDWEALSFEQMEFTYIYELGVAACEIGWKYLFPGEPVPLAVTLLGRYDTWRQSEGDWEGETMPFQYAMRVTCSSPEEFPSWLFDSVEDKYLDWVNEITEQGKIVLKYQEKQDSIVAKTAFVKEAYGLRGLFVNQGAFSSNTVKSVYNPEEHDIMVGFFYKKGLWLVSLRSSKPEVDCSEIAKARGGGGHKAAAGFETKNFEDIFK